MRRIWFPVVAAVAAIALGIGAYVIASPFAAPKLVEPGYVDGWTVTGNSGLMPLVEQTEDPESTEGPGAAARADSASTLSPASIPVLDPTTPEAGEAMLADRLALIDTLALSEPFPDSGSGVTVIDDCATDDPPSDCPPGTAATVLALVRLPDLAISPSTSRADCSTLVNSSSQLGITIRSTVPITLTATYDVDGVEHHSVLVTDPDDRADWEAAGEAGAWTPLIHCLQLSDLPAGWVETVGFDAVDGGGNSVHSYLTVQTDGGAVIPPFRVDTLTNSAIMISIPAVDVSSVRFSATAVPFGQPAVGCAFEDTGESGWIEPMAVIEERLTSEQLATQNYVPLYNERHTAAFVVPEASTVTVCAGWSDSHTWKPFPDHVFGEVLHSPDLIMPRISVDDISLTQRVGSGDLLLQAAVGGTDAPCGREFEPNLSTIGQVICDYSTQPVTSGWDGALIMTATATAFGSTGTRSYVLPVAPQVCGYGCDVPEPQFFDIPLDSRSGPCIGNCSESLAGTVRLRVDWIDGAESWANEWTRDGSVDARPLDPQFDTSATVVLSELNLETWTQSAEVVLNTDRETTVEVVVSGGAVGARTIVDEEFVDSHTIRIDDLEAAARSYTLTLTFTDRDGHVSRYSAEAIGDARFWGGGRFVTDRVPLALDAEVTVESSDGTSVGLGNYRLNVGDTEWSSTGPSVICSPDEIVLPLGSPDRVGGVGIVQELTLDIVLTDPMSPVEVTGDCSEAERIHQWWWRGRVSELDFRAEVTLEELQRGVTVTFVNRNDVITVRLAPAP